MNRAIPIAAIAALTAAIALAAGGGSASSSGPAPSGPGGCRLLPANDQLHRDISGAPVAANSDAVIDRILADGGNDLHPDFGSNPRYGIPFDVVRANARRVPVRITAYPDESNRGRHPIPRDASIEGGRRSKGDRHALVLERDGPDADADCRLIELFRAFPPRRGRGWRAAQVSVFDLGRALPSRPDGWTSADAAGLPILPALVRYDEVRGGQIDHAIRMTVERSRRAYLSPASHFASAECGPNLPPMGLRLRLRANYPIASFSAQAKPIAEALKTYGAIVADNGSNFFVTGASSRRWDDDQLSDLKGISGNAFEVVDTGADLTTPC